MSIKEFADSLRIKEEEALLFTDAWDVLMERFKIPEEHHGEIFSILKDFFITLDTDFLTIYDLNNSIEAINFFISYQESMNEMLSRYNDSTFIIDSRMQLQILSNNLPSTLNYPGAARLSVRLLYQFLRSADIYLLYHLEPYKEIPSLDILKEVKEILSHDYDYKHQLWLIDTINQLKGYI